MMNKDKMKPEIVKSNEHLHWPTHKKFKANIKDKKSYIICSSFCFKIQDHVYNLTDHWDSVTTHNVFKQ